MSKLHIPYLRPSFLRPSLLALAIAQTFSFAATAQAQTQAEAQTQTQSQTQNKETSLPEVVISGTKLTKAASASVGGFAETALLETPLSIAVFNQQQLQDLRIRTTSDAMKFDASVSDAYNAVGYAEQFSIRGFILDNSSSYRKDGLTIPSDAAIPLENKERLEILKGMAGFQAGFATPGGVVNYVTKRPTTSQYQSATIELSERGTLYGTLDVGGTTDSQVFGYRINLASEKLRSYVKGADGNRQFVSSAFDWHISPQALLQVDMDYQTKSQLTAPGFQLFNGTDLPRNVRADMMLNNQPWAKPVDTRSGNIGLRFEYQFNTDWRATISANRHTFKRDDFTAFPYGCSSADLYPGYCANGDYDVYDYQSVNESKSPVATQAIVNGTFKTGNMQHNIAFGVSSSQRKDHFGDYVYDFVGTSNLFNPSVVPQSGNVTGPILLRRTDREWSVFTQDIIDLSAQFKLHLGLRHVAISRQELSATTYEKSYQLPSIALVFKPQANISSYATFSQGLEHGGVAPFGTSNEFQVQNPSKSKQVEVGVKAELTRDLLISAAAFRINKPLEYINNSNTYVNNGTATHTGLELSAQGQINRNLVLGVSLTALNARQQDTGVVALDDKRVTNVPKLKSVAYLDYTFTDIPKLSINGSWNYTGNKAFQPDNSVIVPSYSVFNLGARYLMQVAGVVTTLRVNVDNVSDRFYWRDVTQSQGGYLFPGAPRTLKVSAQFDF